MLENVKMIWILHHKTYKLGKKDLIIFFTFSTEMNGFKGFLLNIFVIFFSIMEFVLLQYSLFDSLLPL
jgi:hypothetical protein